MTKTMTMTKTTIILIVMCSMLTSRNCASQNVSMSSSNILTTTVATATKEVTSKVSTSSNSKNVESSSMTTSSLSSPSNTAISPSASSLNATSAPPTATAFSSPGNISPSAVTPVPSTASPSVATTSSSSVTTPTTTPPTMPTMDFPPDPSVGLCSCDLAMGRCDINCCCDPDCAVGIKSIFSTCIDAVARDRQLPVPFCVSEGVIVGTNNLPSVKKVESSGLFCITDWNYEEQKFFPSRLPLSSSEIESQLDKLASSSPDFDSLLPSKDNLVDVSRHDRADVSRDVALTSSKYRVGEPFVVILTDEQPSRSSCATFNLPAPSTFTSGCVDSAPTPFLEDRVDVVCDRTSRRLAEECVGGGGDDEKKKSPLHSAFYIGKAGEAVLPGRIIKRRANGSTFDVFGCAVPPSSSPFDPPQNLVTIAIKGAACNASFDGANRKCHDVVKSVRYDVYVDETGWISKMEASFSCGSVDENKFDKSAVVRIRHSIKFILVSDGGGNGSWQNSFLRSGNPGYLSGKPILAGTINGTDDLPSEERNILISADPSTWLTVPSSSSSSSFGFCSRQPVLFEEDSGHICKLDLKNVSNCASLEEILANLFKGSSNSRPDRVGIFGNSDPNKVAQWIPFADEGYPSSSTSSSSSSVCQNVVVAVSVKAFFARVGAIANPQPQILAVSRIFKAKDVDIDKGFIFLHASASFVDVTEEAENYLNPSPPISATVPRDFFYPLFQRRSDRDDGGGGETYDNNAASGRNERSTAGVLLLALVSTSFIR